jgi:hypothetical protein
MTGSESGISKLGREQNELRGREVDCQCAVTLGGATGCKKDWLGLIFGGWRCRYARAELDNADVNVLEVDGYLRNLGEQLKVAPAIVSDNI